MSIANIYSGFGGSSIVKAGLIIVGDALFRIGVAQQLRAKIGEFKIVQNETSFLILIVIICTLKSAFLSNSGCIAILLCGCPLSQMWQQDQKEGSAPKWSLCQQVSFALLRCFYLDRFCIAGDNELHFDGTAGYVDGMGFLI
jgi:hypothetical protein